jgi:hypothetical protein
MSQAVAPPPKTEAFGGTLEVFISRRRFLRHAVFYG